MTRQFHPLAHYFLVKYDVTYIAYDMDMKWDVSIINNILKYDYKSDPKSMQSHLEDLPHKEVLEKLLYRSSARQQKIKRIF